MGPLLVPYGASNSVRVPHVQFRLVLRIVVPYPVLHLTSAWAPYGTSRGHARVLEIRFVKHTETT